MNDFDGEGEPFEVRVGAGLDRPRLDVFLADVIEDASRSFVQKLIKDKRVKLNGQVCSRSSRSVFEGDSIEAQIPPPVPSELLPEPIPLCVLYEDRHILVVDKQSGLVVHPAPGHPSGTLVNAVLHHCADFDIPIDEPAKDPSEPLRPGIVHRLDRFTSGVMVVAKTPRAFNGLSQQAREHTFDRRYLALVRGEFKERAGRIDAAIGRSMSERGRMAVTAVKSRDAVTRFEVLERFGVASLIALRLETGRTHQIRVHLRFAGRPVLGDPIYGVTEFNKMKIGDPLRQALAALQGQALHAALLGLDHPETGERMTFETGPPEDFQEVLDLLREASAP